MSKRPVPREAIMRSVRARIAYWAEDVEPIEHVIFCLEQSISKCEQKYGIISERLQAAVDVSQIEETYEISCWLADYDVLNRLKKEVEVMNEKGGP